MTRQGGEMGGVSDKMMGLKGRGRDESEINKSTVRQLWLCQPLTAVTATFEVKLRAVVDGRRGSTASRSDVMEMLPGEATFCFTFIQGVSTETHLCISMYSKPLENLEMEYFTINNAKSRPLD